MSGGHFEYIQFRFLDPIEELENIIKNKNGEYSEESINKIKECIQYLKLSSIYLNRIDLVLSGDCSEENLSKDINHEINNIRN